MSEEEFDRRYDVVARRTIGARVYVVTGEAVRRYGSIDAAIDQMLSREADANRPEPRKPWTGEVRR